MNKGILCVIVCAGLLYAQTQADIKNWQTGETIPGTENITPGPGVNLSSWNTTSKNLDYAALMNMDLFNARFNNSWLKYANFNESNLKEARFGMHISQMPL